MKKELSKRHSIYKKIREIIENARTRALYAVNTEMVRAYWLIGKEIVEEEQKGKRRAEYGISLVKELSLRLTAEFGKGFTETNLKYMRQFYLTYPKLYALRRESEKSHALRDESAKRYALRHELTWTHYRLLCRVEKT
jgi:hypothetical protein